MTGMSAEHAAELVTNEFSDAEDNLINDFHECGENGDELFSAYSNQAGRYWMCCGSSLRWCRGWKQWRFIPSDDDQAMVTDSCINADVWL